MTSTDFKRTPLFESHKKLGAKIVPFAGWEMPVQYSGVIAEHNAVRERAGIFDVSHMGELIVKGKDAEKFIQGITCNDLSKIVDGKAQYNALINESGGVIDDIFVYRFNSEHFLICVNASNADVDYAWLKAHLSPGVVGVTLENASDRYGLIAIQGPKARAIVAKKDKGLLEIKPFFFVSVKFNGVEVLVARTGYTGEDGFEIFTPWNETEKVWNYILELGEEDGLIPCGLGARDSLRLEACYPLHGHELSPEISAMESGLSWIIKPEKGAFIGHEILKQQKEQGARRSLVGFFIDEAGIARQGDKLFSINGDEIGVVTSGTKTPTVQKALGLAFCNSEFAALETKISVEVRGKRLHAHVVKRPFYSKKEFTHS